MSQGQEVFLFTPTSVPGCAFWLDATDVNGNGSTVADGTVISTWTDKSGNGRNFTQATAGNRPTYGTFLSRPGISFNGANSQNLSNAYIQTGSGGRNTFIVFYDVNTSANQYGNPVLFYMANTNQSALGDWRAAYDGANNYLGTDALAGAYLYRTSPAVTTMRTARCVALWGYNTGSGFNTAYVYGNGTQFTTLVNSFAATSPLNVTNTGTTSVGGGQTGYATAVISELIYYNTDITTAQRQQLEGYLAWKWGLQGSLPSNHPYKTYRPLAQTPFPTQIPNMPIITQGVQAFVPLQISGCQLWLDATDPAATGIPPASGAAVTQWRDKSTNRLTGTGVNSPTYQANIQNGLPVIRFNGTNQYINFGNVLNLGTNGITVFMVTKYAINAGNQVGMVGKASYRGNPGRWAFVYDTVAGGPNGVGVDFFIEDTNQSLTGIVFNPATRFNIFTAVNNRTSFNRIYANGSFGSQQTFTATANNLSNTDPLYVAAYPDGTGSGPQSGMFMNGDIAEIIVYFSALSDTQRQQVEGYLAWKWGLLSNLPNGHPYKAQPIVPFPARSVAFNGNASSWLPTRITGCQLWLDASDRATITAAATITGWADKSGNSRTVTFVGTNNTYNASTQSVNTDNATVNYFYANVNLKRSVATFANVFLVHTWTGSASGGNQGLWGQDIGGGWNRFQLLSFTANSAFAYGLSYTPSSPNVVVATALNTASRVVYNATYAYQVPSGTYVTVNGTLASTPVTEVPASPETSTTNTYFGTIDTGYSGKVAFHEILIYTTNLTRAQTQTVEGYLAWKWGLQGNLPANHPYKLWPPPP